MQVMQADESLFEPIVVCDEPQEGSEVARGTAVKGWAYSPAGIREVSVWLDGQRVGVAEYGLPREDVSELRPEWPGAERSGFRYRLEVVPATVASSGSVELTVAAEDGQGRRVEARRAVQVDESLLDPILVYDEPEQGSEVTRGTIVSGWVYSPAGIKEISVWLDGQKVVGQTEYGLLREDVSELRPEWPGAERSGFRYRLEVVPATPASSESVELTVVAVDGQGRRVEARRLVRAEGSLFEPIVVCDELQEGSEVARGAVVEGWAYSPAGIREVSVWLDGQRVGEAERGLEREDVAEAHPEWPDAERCGFRYRLETLLISELAESAELTVVAEDERGRRAEVRRVIRRDLEALFEEKLRNNRRELARKRDQLRATKDRVELTEYQKVAKKIRLEIFELEGELRAVKERRAEDQGSVTGVLPDFVVIGANKCGTSFFYHLLTQHPLVEPAASKELHFFDLLFDEGVEWYRRCFPAPRWEDGRKTITGEATPGYFAHPSAPERLAQVVPQARLITLLRNPVDRTYSAYHHRVRKGQETRTFEEAVKAEINPGDRPSKLLLRLFKRLVGLFLRSGDSGRRAVARSIYVDHLQPWSAYFPKEQMLVLKSEDFFDNPTETLKSVFSFLDLPEWEPEASQLDDKRNTGGYKEQMDPATRRRLEEYFEPHNKRLYEFLGVDFGW